MTRAKPTHHSRPGGSRRIVSIRWIVSFAVIMLIAATVFGVGSVAERNARNALTQEIQTRLLLEARNLALLSSDALLSELPELVIFPVVAEMKSERSDVVLVLVLDHKGTIQGHPDARMLGTQFELMDSLQSLRFDGRLNEGERFLADQEMIVASVPVMHAEGQQLGTALVGLGRDYLQSTIVRSRRELILLSTLLLAAGILCAVVLMSRLLRPIATLRRGLERIGQGDLNTPLEVHGRTELGLLALTVNDMAEKLRLAQDEMLEKERLDHEMGLAHKIQQSLLPSGPTEVGDFIIQGSYQAATEVGGDYYDVSPLPDGRMSVVIADVAGKGLTGCLVTSMLAVLLRTLKPLHSSPTALMVELEKLLSGSLQRGTFVTMFYGILDPSIGRMVFASAAHSPLLVHRGGENKSEWYRTKGIPIGASRGGLLEKTLEDLVIDLGPGDLILQYTDGLNEAWSPTREEQFGFARIEEVVKAHARRDPAAILAELSAATETWTESLPPGDDLTLLMIARAGGPAKLTTGVRASEPARRPDADDPRGRLLNTLPGAPHLGLHASLSELERLRPWTDSIAELELLPEPHRRLIQQALYEACSNVVEHGCQHDPSKLIDLWWLSTGPAWRVDGSENAPSPGDLSRAKERVRRGYFLICDQGESFEMKGWSPPDMTDPAVRRRGRGLGLHIIHAAMTRVVYLPDAPAGNITLLRFDPTKHATEREDQNVRTRV